MLINDTLTSPHERQQRKESLCLFPGCFSKSISIFSFETRTDTKALVKVYTEFCFSPAQYCLYLVRESWCISQTVRLCFHCATVRFLLWRGFQNLPRVFCEDFVCKHENKQPETPLFSTQA